MGLTVLVVEVGHYANPENREPVEFLIDSGAVHSVVPSDVLQRLGITPYDEKEYRLADGSRIHRKRGFAFFKYRDSGAVADAIFGEPGDSPLLGATTLESLGFVLDPLHRELRPLPMILAQFAYPRPIG